MERKLAAILAGDVAGCSRLMEQDEAGTFERLKALRIELVEPAIALHHGCVFKLMGDGLLAEFASVVEAGRMHCRRPARIGRAKPKSPIWQKPASQRNSEAPGWG